MPYFEIRVKGQLDSSWSEWFEGLKVTGEETGETALCGIIPDQAALFGILLKIRDLGLELLSLYSRPVNAEKPS